jgi:preprotein translocase subunit SecD
MKLSKFKLASVFILCLLSCMVCLPNFLSKSTLEKFPSWMPTATVNLGLDLRGGSHLLLGVDFSRYIKEQLELTRETIKQALRAEKIKFDDLMVGKDNITLVTKDIQDVDLAMKTIRRIGGMEIEKESNVLTVQYTSDYLEELRKNVLSQSIEIIRRRVDETGTKEPTIQAQGKFNILLQVPGLDNPESLKQMLGKTAKLTFHLVNHDFDSSLLVAPHDSMILGEEDPSAGKVIRHAVYKKVLLTGDMLKNARATVREGQPQVDFEFNAIGTKKFAEVTSSNVGKRLAIVLDNKIISAPAINGAILGGSGYISGNFTFATASELALLLRAGALPAPLDIIEERTVGPSLGIASIESGKISAAIGIIAVMCFMIITYGLFGLFANIALIFNMSFLVALLSILQATLTMPGIAGIVLTMGMAVDANVLIFERIREESKLGYNPAIAVNKGFEQAFGTIFDSNLTTIIAAIFLYAYGSGVVRGFSVTLVIGILCSMFSAITLTKIMVQLWIKLRNPSKIIWI